MRGSPEVFRLVFNQGAKRSTEILELLISLCAPRLLNTTSYLRVGPSIKICLERALIPFEKEDGEGGGIIQRPRKPDWAFSCLFHFSYGASHSSARLASPSRSLFKLLSIRRQSDLSVLAVLKDLDALTSRLLHPSLPLPPATLK